MAKNKVKKQGDKKAIKINIGVSILLVVVLSFVSIGYGLYGQRLDISGTTKVKTQGKIAITNVTLTSSVNVRDDSIPTYTDESVDFNLTFEKAAGSTEPNYQAVYSITIENDTFYNHEFNFGTFQPIITNSSGIEVDPNYLTYTLDGIQIGDMIPAGESVTFTLTLDFNPEEDDTYSVDGNLEPELVEEPHGSLLGSITSNQTGDLRESLNNNIAEFTIEVINSYQSQRTFSLNISDTSHFKLVDSNGNDLSSFTIEGGTTNTYTFYVKRVDNAIFTNSSMTTNISLSYSEASNVNCGNITLLVDESELEDTTPPVISNVLASIANATRDVTSETDTSSVGQIAVTWNGVDAESGVKKYYVNLYSVSGNTETYVDTYSTVGDETSLTISDLADGSYVVKVYGENNDGYKPNDSEISSATTSSGVCSKSNSGTYNWHHTVSLTSNSQYINALTNTKVNRGWNYTTTLTKYSNTNNYTYTLPSTITVTMNGSTLSTGTSAGRYQYNSNTGVVTVYGVTGNVTIRAVATRSSSGGGCGG